jgi:signal peptidase II
VQPGRGQLRWLWLTLFVIVLDQLSKAWVRTHIGLHESIDLLPVFSLTHWLNPGAAFNFLAGQTGWQRWFFALLAAGVSVALVVWLRRMPRSAQLTGAALGLILGGALGNLVDRVHSGLVVDFLLVHWNEHYFPAFNVADSAITVGAVLLLLDAYLGQRKPL